jgi:SAM-dependent methyltransferase
VADGSERIGGDRVKGAEDTGYWQHVRSEIEPLLEGQPTRILEIGCGGGHTLAWLKKRWPDAQTVGVDGWQDIAEELKRHADVAIIHDLEQPLPELGEFDLILALDVLEHLRRPEDTMKALMALLRPGGAIIVSVPNIAHVDIIGDLLFRRRFQYSDAGILDRTHLHFFTERSALALMEDAGLTVREGIINGLARKRSRLLMAATLGLARHYLVVQYIMRGVRGAPSRKVRWRASS